VHFSTLKSLKAPCGSSIASSAFFFSIFSLIGIHRWRILSLCPHPSFSHHPHTHTLSLSVSLSLSLSLSPFANEVCLSFGLRLLLDTNGDTSQFYLIVAALIFNYVKSLFHPFFSSNPASETLHGLESVEASSIPPLQNK